MASFIFNNFKKRFLAGEVPSADSWDFIPVNSDFRTTFEHDNISLEHYRTIQDFQDVNPNAFCFETEKTYSSTNKFGDTLNQVEKQIINFQIKGIKSLKNNKGIKASKGSTRIQIDTHNPTAFGGYSLLRGNQLIRHWTKILREEETLSKKPMFIKGSNVKQFLQFYGNTVSANPLTASYLSSGGFYFIQSKEQLSWFAERSNTGNNSIIGVFGDDIEGVFDNEPIGKDEAYPFEGILDGNGCKIYNFSINCDGTDNGIVGVLGTHGVVRNFSIESNGENNNLICNKRINLDHIKKDARDINCGLLVGRNYGLIENIDAFRMNVVKLSGFVPEVYSVTNKSDNYTWSDGFIRDKFDVANENFYYLNSFCINSPGNICPYVGYFAEGYYGEGTYAWQRLLNPDDNSSYMAVDTELSAVNLSSNIDDKYLYTKINPGSSVFLTKSVSYKNDAGEQLTAENCLTGMKLKVFNDLVYGVNGPYINSKKLWETDLNKNASTYWLGSSHSGEIINTVEKLARLPIYYFLDNKGNYTTCIASAEDDVVSLTSQPWSIYSHSPQMLYNANLLTEMASAKNGLCVKERVGSAYHQTSMRMHPMARAAYNVGIIAGANFGIINQVSIKSLIQNTSNFVGFIGGLAGKQERGLINNCAVDVDYELIYDFGTQVSAGDSVTYKGTPLLSPECKKFFDGYYLSSTYYNESNIDILFSSFYDDNENVNTAKTVTNDCVTYKLRPIFVAGGLFGRYIPSFNSGTSSHFGVLSYNGDKDKYLWGTQVANTTVLYKDNYNYTNSNDSACFKRIENAFGVIAGKVDYETSNAGIDETILSNDCTLKITNCIFSADVDVGKGDIVGAGVGDPILVRNKYKLDNNFYFSKSKYVGIFEIKYNELNSIAVNNICSIRSNKTCVGEDTNIPYALDYPFHTRENNASFQRGYCITNSNSLNKNSPYGLTRPNSLNKYDLIPNLIKFEFCKTNIDPVFAFYGDYWAYHLKPMEYQPGSEKLYTYSEAYSTYNLKGYTEKVIDEKDGIGNQNILDGYTYVSSYYEANLVYGTDKNDSKITPKYISTSGDDNFGATITATEKEYWNELEGSYHNPRIFVKNIIGDSTPGWCPINFSAQNLLYLINEEMSGYNNSMLSFVEGETLAISESNLNLDIGFKKEKPEDKYYGYKYTTSSYPINPYVGYKLTVPEENTFNFKLPVYFTQFDNENNKLGYIVQDPRSGFEGDSGMYFNNNIISLGESFSPSVIRERIQAAIDEAGNSSAGFDSTGVSANEDNNFAGLLVIDSSGNNVMFIENNGLPLTGNSWNYVCKNINNNGGLLFEVK